MLLSKYWNMALNQQKLQTSLTQKKHHSDFLLYQGYIFETASATKMHSCL